MERPRPSLRTRFVVACALLVVTGTVASAWTLAALSRLGDDMAASVAHSDDVTAATAGVAGALEREDDALLLVAAGDVHGAAAIARERVRTDEAIARLVGLGPDADALAPAIAAYRRAVDGAVALPAEGQLLHYHRHVNPVLRQAVAVIAGLRDRHFATSQRAAAAARDEVGRARGVVLAIAVAALLVSVLVALRLARAVIGPLDQLRRSARAIQDGDLDARARVRGGDELGDVAAAFNAMARSLAQFRRSNLDEVLQAKATLEATLEALPDAVVVIEPDGGLAALNGEAIALLHDLGVATPTTSADLAPLGVSEPRLVGALAGEPPAAALALDAAIPVQRGAVTRHLLPRLVPAAGPDEDHSRAVLVVSDLTDLVRLDAMRAEMIAVASHELRTPLTTLRMTLLMLEEGAAELPARARALVETARGGADQLVETVDELLDLTRIEAGELRLHREPVDVGALVREAAARWQARAADAEVRLEAAVEDGPPLLGDRRRLRSVIDNLVDNAIKYAPPGTAVSLALSQKSGGVQLVVADAGPGVPAALRERVFDKFYRVEHERPHGRAARGAGIGLYLCRQLVELHGGSIRCEAGPGGRIVAELPRGP